MNQATVSMAAAFKASGMFPDLKSEAQAIVKIQAGMELGLGAFEAMQGINVIQGKTAMTAQLVASRIKKSGKYNYRIVRHDDEACVLDFYEGGEKVGSSSFTIDDAKNAGLGGGNYNKYPRNMLFARAVTNGARWYCPDVFGGAVYTEDELRAPLAAEPAPQHGGADAIVEAAKQLPGVTTAAEVQAPVFGQQHADKLREILSENGIDAADLVAEIDANDDPLFEPCRGQPIEDWPRTTPIRERISKWINNTIAARQEAADRDPGADEEVAVEATGE